MRSTPHVLSTRVASGQLKAIKRAAASRGLDVATFTRVALARLSDGGSAEALALARLSDGGSAEALALLEDLITALGLDPATASADTVMAAIYEMVANAPPTEGDVKAQGPIDPLQAGAAPKHEQLSKLQIAACTRRGVPATPQGWATLCRSAARGTSAKPGAAAPAARPATPTALSKGERDYCAKHSLTHVQFAVKKANATRRSR